MLEAEDSCKTHETKSPWRTGEELDPASERVGAHELESSSRGERERERKRSVQTGKEAEATRPRADLLLLDSTFLVPVHGLRSSCDVGLEDMGTTTSCSHQQRICHHQLHRHQCYQCHNTHCHGCEPKNQTTRILQNQNYLPLKPPVFQTAKTHTHTHTNSSLLPEGNKLLKPQKRWKQEERERERKREEEDNGAKLLQVPSSSTFFFFLFNTLKAPFWHGTK